MPRQQNVDFAKHPRCRAKISPKQEKVLRDMNKLNTTKRIISNLHKIDNNPRIASNFYNLEVKNGRIRIDTGSGPYWVDIAYDSKASINYTVCGAVMKGIIGAVTLNNLEPLTLGVTPDPQVIVTNEPEPVIDPDPVPDPVITTPVVTEPSDKYEALFAKMNALRDYCRNTGGKDTDEPTTGSMGIGMKMLDHGFSQEAIIHALTINWPDTARRANLIDDYDPMTYGTVDNGYHRLSPYVLALVKAGVAPLLVGPTQSGKSTLAKHVAKQLGVAFDACPLTGGASPGWLLGRDSRDGFQPSDFVKRYTEGGVFLFDEVDAADPNMMIILNDALVSDTFSHPYMGKLDRHPEFFAIAAANTWGTGANAKYRGRNRMDGATLERFRLGRVYVDYDRELERKIMESHRDKANA